MILVKRPFATCCRPTRERVNAADEFGGGRSG